MRTDNERDTEVVDLTARDPIDGDDITITPSAGPHGKPRRGRALAFVSLAVVAGGAVVALAVGASRHRSSEQRVSAGVTPTTDATATRDTAAAPTTPTSTAAAAPTTLPSRSAPPNAVAPRTTLPTNRSAVPPPVASPPSNAHTPATVATSPPSVLQWSASPASLKVAAGGTTVVTVTVRNPSDGVVTLPVPLGCAPKLDGSGVCPEVAQIMQPHTQEAVHYPVDATNVAPGSYQLMIEDGLFSIPVTVTP